MNRHGRIVCSLLICLGAGLAGCRPASEAAIDAGVEAGKSSRPAAEAGLDLEAQTAAAVEDLSERIGVAAAEIDVLEARNVTWPDAAAGCPRPGMVYLQVLTPGALVRLEAAGREYRYHARGGSLPLPCPAKQAVKPLPGSADR